MRPFQETFLVGGSVIYGRADDKNRIIELLFSEDGDNLNSTVVSIVADRGTGRTTLLHLLHSELCNAFDIRKFICMPEKFDEKGLMRVILESLTGIPCDITDMEILEETVKEELMDQRLLLLLDNFENKSQRCWDLLSSLVKDCTKKSAVVVTATKKAVAEVKGPIQFYYMNKLSNEWCWMIFKECAFTGQNPNPNTELADIGKRLVAKCRKVTLCIKVLSGLLRHSVTDDWWRAVLDNNFWEMDDVEGDVLPALRVCYELLPSCLKQCFKYCSLFPKEYIYSKQHLVCIWLSQGFIEPGEAREIEDIGLEYFDQLLSLSFFQPSLIHDMEENKFVMPGLIHDLAQQLSKNECFQFEGCVQRAPENTCHLSLVPHEFQSVSPDHLINRAENLQTFLVVSRSTFQHQNISSSILNLVDLEDLFVKFHSITTLDLSNTDIEELPESFRSLNKLRYLGLNSTKIKRIPLKISNLIQLQALEAKNCHYLEELPRTIEALTNLHYLDVTKEAGYVIMPCGIGKLTNLRRLATFNIGMDPLLHCGIEELKDMEHLKGCLEITGLVNVSSGIDAEEAHMRSKEHIETLFLHWSDGRTFLEGEEDAEIAEEVLQSLHPTDNLKEMIIRGYPGKKFPMWIECAHFCRLTSIILDHCYNCVSLPDLGGLPLLRFLSIQKMYCVQKMSLSDSEYAPENSIKYPSLEQLTIWEMYELVEWVEIGNRDFPVLHSVCINKCPLLRNIPKFSTLVELSVYSCAQYLEVMDLPSLQSLRIEGLQKTKSVRLPKSLVGLKKLEISHCPELLSVVGLSLLNSLETINFVSCPQLKREENTRKELTFSDEVDFSGSGLWDERQKRPIVSNKRKGREDLSSLSSGLTEGHKKINELESQISRQDQMSVQEVETAAQSSMGNFKRSPLISHSAYTNLFPPTDKGSASAERRSGRYMPSFLFTPRPTASGSTFKGAPQETRNLLNLHISPEPSATTDCSLGTTSKTVFGTASTTTTVSTDSKIHHRHPKKCQFEGCSKGARGASGLCIAHGGGRRCQKAGCNKAAEGRTIFCKAHGGGRRCEYLGCTKSAEGKTDFCIAHGGGRQCSHQGCSKAARGKSGLCIRHGGGKRCKIDGCARSAEGQAGLCISHGGGRRCQYMGCSKGAQGSTKFCKAHGGGKRCTFKGCTKGAEGSTPLCKDHGGGKRCKYLGCTESAEGKTDYCIAHDGEYIWHYPPHLLDEVWRLQNIVKDGAFHTKLSENNINNVQHFLRLLNVDPNHLRRILGMSDKMWEITVNHAKTCDPGDEIYSHSSQNATIFFNSIYELVSAKISGVPYSLQELPSNKKDYILQLVQEAYQQWGSPREADGVPSVAPIQSKTVNQGHPPNQEDFQKGGLDQDEVSTSFPAESSSSILGPEFHSGPYN